MLVCWLYCILCALVLVAWWTKFVEIRVYLWGNYAAERRELCGVLKQCVPDILGLSHI